MDMVVVQLVAHLMPGPDRPAGAPSHLYRTVTRAWPGVPRVGDFVSLGGGDVVVRPVTSVQWGDGGVSVYTGPLPEEDRAALLDLGFTAAKPAST